MKHKFWLPCIDFPLIITLIFKNFFYILLITFKAFRDQALNYIKKQLTTYDP